MEMTTVGIDDIVGFKRLISGCGGNWDLYYEHVPERHFHYSSEHPALNGSPLCRAGFRSSRESSYSTSSIAYSCHRCLRDVHSQKIPPLSLSNGLWTGAAEVPELAGLTFVEEKLLARVHVSIQLVKYRLFHQWHADGFHPQPKV
jgi:hypothetical protein